MDRVRNAITLSLLLLLLAGCTQGGNVVKTKPADFNVQYNWVEGTVPPPYHYEYTVTVDAKGQGQVVMIPGYGPGEGVPTWTEPFQVQPADLDAFFKLLRDKGMFSTGWKARNDPPVGGSSDWLQVTADGKVYSIPSYVVAGQAQAAEEICAAARALAPQAVWDKLEAQREEFVQQQLNK